jgi:hypothetical protein
MIWCKQFFNYDVEHWLKGDTLRAPESRLCGRNRYWKHLKASDVISMPDSWSIRGSQPGTSLFIAAR